MTLAKKTRPAPWTLMQRRPSRKQRRNNSAYLTKRRDFLIEHPWCEWGLRQSPVQHIRATDIHHLRGRAGQLLLDERYWLAVSRKAHDWIH